jgi:hypothetical protein
MGGVFLFAMGTGQAARIISYVHVP